MKRKMIYLLLGFVAAVSISGCGQNEEETEFSTSAPEETAEEDMDLSALDEETEEEASLEPITPSDYLVQDTADYVVLGDYEGIAVEQYTYEVTMRWCRMKSSSIWKCPERKWRQTVPLNPEISYTSP